MCNRVVRLFLNCIEVRWALVTLTHSSQLKKALAYVSEVPRLCWRNVPHKRVKHTSE